MLPALRRRELHRGRVSRGHRREREEEGRLLRGLLRAVRAGRVPGRRPVREVSLSEHDDGRGCDGVLRVRHRLLLFAVPRRFGALRRPGGARGAVSGGRGHVLRQVLPSVRARHGLCQPGEQHTPGRRDRGRLVAGVGILGPLVPLRELGELQGGALHGGAQRRHVPRLRGRLPLLVHGAPVFEVRISA